MEESGLNHQLEQRPAMLAADIQPVDTVLPVKFYFAVLTGRAVEF